MTGAQPGGAPDIRAAVARALLRRWAPVDSVLGDEALTMLGESLDRLAELESDPRYLIGRLQQALTALLAADVPAPDAMERLMGDAIADAIEFRTGLYLAHDCGSICDICGPDHVRAVRYDSLVRELGLAGPDPETPAGIAGRAARQQDDRARAESAARLTAAAAVRGGFERESHAYATAGGLAPDWATWSQRLSLALAGLLDELGAAR